MPKEVVPGYVSETIPERSKGFDILVGWNKEKEYAQLAVVESDRNQPGIKIGNSDEIFHGLYSTLDAEGIDQLLKVLRKVKRQIFPKEK